MSKTLIKRGAGTGGPVCSAGAGFGCSRGAAAAMADMVKAWLADMPDQDPRTKDWPLMSSPWIPIGMSVAYLVVCLGGMEIMKNRKPFENLKNPLLGYNVVIIGLNGYILKELLITAYNEGMYKSVCAEVNYAPTPNATRMAAAVWWYYFSKSIEWVDSFTMVLRKKNRQLSFLHLYHHSTMFPIWWIGTAYVAGGNSIFCSAFNSFVHVVMYTYYFLSGVGVKVPLGLKKSLTKLQLSQFFAVIGHCVYTLIGTHMGFCTWPLWMAIANALYMTSFVVLFGAFYVANYKAKRKAEKAKQ